MTPQEFDQLVEKVGAEAAKKIKAEMEAHNKKLAEIETAIKEQKGFVTEAQYKELKESCETTIKEIKGIVEKQGLTLAELKTASEPKPTAIKSIADFLKDEADQLKTFLANGTGNKTYVLDYTDSGMPYLKQHNLVTSKEAYRAKAASTHATIDGIGGGVSSILQSFDAASLLRLATGSPIFNQYRNTQWLFDLCNVINGTYDTQQQLAVWFDEVPQDGGSDTVAEGSAKPLTQYKYELKSNPYRKEATALSLTEEFSIDFAQLENNILGVGRTDVLNKVNTKVLANIISRASAYNSASAFTGGTALANVNDFDALAALTAQVDNNTFSNVKANAALVNTYRKYRMGVIKNSQGAYLNPPDVIKDLNVIGNPTVTADTAIVGDLKQYNILMRGPLVVRIGYNGSDFINNQFSIVIEQYYYDWIPTSRKPAIVTAGLDTVKQLLSA